MKRPAVFVASLLAAALAIVAAGPAPAAPAARDTLDTAPALWRHPVAAVAHDAADLATAPLHFSSCDWAVTAGVAALAGVMVASWDGDVRAARRTDAGVLPYDALRRPAELGRWYGASDTHAVAALAAAVGSLGAVGLVRRDTYLFGTAALAAESVAFAVAVTGVVKVAAGRDRPLADKGPHSFHPFSAGANGTGFSLPSGHTAAAFALATTLSRRYPRWWVVLPAYTVAAGIAAQRVDAGAHWASDTVVGAAIGYGVAARLAAGRGRLHLAAVPGPGGVNLAAAWRW